MPVARPCPQAALARDNGTHTKYHTGQQKSNANQPASRYPSAMSRGRRQQCPEKQACTKRLDRLVNQVASASIQVTLGDDTITEKVKFCSLSDTQGAVCAQLQAPMRGLTSACTRNSSALSLCEHLAGPLVMLVRWCVCVCMCVCVHSQRRRRTDDVAGFVRSVAPQSRGKCCTPALIGTLVAFVAHSFLCSPKWMARWHTCVPCLLSSAHQRRRRRISTSRILRCTGMLRRPCSYGFVS